MKNILPAILIVSACTLCGQVKDKVFSYLPLKENLEAASGAKLKAVFYRKSVARTPDFKEVAAGQPRFWKGEVFLEPGGNTMERGTINLLSAKEDFKNSKPLHRFVRERLFLNNTDLLSKSIRFGICADRLLREISREARKNALFILFRARIPAKEKLKLMLIGFFPRTYKKLISAKE